MLKNIVLSVFYIVLYSLIVAALLSVRSSMLTVYFGVFISLIMVTFVFIATSREQIELTVSQLCDWVGSKWN
ncbi:hypothetical protein BJD49_gp031 [Acinetobacter phage vB_AbaM_phiAbaA1]|uniref:hypothetical protein n=1 Tax=Acinetobacter phage vB_AbaM_phiAbaA1 TaxID=1605379 RepID=UPI00078BA68F|nr:hypothetical protein BJD49_gp031 [Acinetobacter phage vB_AbaM_phiAbaA1]AJK27259.1 hypothetical protein phiAbaA1_156 [Acinetobacter phage vB_AbaM_phiAbaA1]